MYTKITFNLDDSQTVRMGEEWGERGNAMVTLS